MRILIVAATSFEIAPLDAALKHPHAGQEIDVLLTGIGMVATAAQCSRRLQQAEYDLALNLGLCGSFDPSLTVGSVVHVIADRIAELGVEDGERFVTMQELILIGDNDFPYRDGQLFNPMPISIPPLESLRRVVGITVNTVHGDERSIAVVRERFNPDVESMEGA